MHGKTTGWVGVGISPSGGMIDADIFVGWVKDGVPTITVRNHSINRGCNYYTIHVQRAHQLHITVHLNELMLKQDRHGQSENAYPPFDDEQDLTLLGGDERNGWTRIKFQRQIAGCEKGFDLPLTVSLMCLFTKLVNLNDTIKKRPCNKQFYRSSNPHCAILILQTLQNYNVLRRKLLCC